MPGAAGVGTAYGIVALGVLGVDGVWGELTTLAWGMWRMGPFKGRQIWAHDTEFTLMDPSRWQAQLLRRDEVSLLGIWIGECLPGADILSLGEQSVCLCVCACVCMCVWCPSRLCPWGLWEAARLCISRSPLHCLSLPLLTSSLCLPFPEGPGSSPDISECSLPTPSLSAALSGWAGSYQAHGVIGSGGICGRDGQVA